MLAFAAGCRRRAAGTGRESLMTELVGLAVVASAGAMFLGYGFKGSLAVYLPGGSDYPYVTNDALMSVYMFNDFAPFIAWWGIQMATVGIAWVALRERVLPRWLGAVAAVFAVLPMILLFAVGLPGFPGVTHPFWMIVNGVAMTLVLRRATRSAPATSSVRPGVSAAVAG